MLVIFARTKHLGASVSIATEMLINYLENEIADVNLYTLERKIDEI